jgi:hypothetical protein
MAAPGTVTHVLEVAALVKAASDAHLAVTAETAAAAVPATPPEATPAPPA